MDFSWISPVPRLRRRQLSGRDGARLHGAGAGQALQARAGVLDTDAEGLGGARSSNRSHEAETWGGEETQW